VASAKFVTISSLLCVVLLPKTSAGSVTHSTPIPTKSKAYGVYICLNPLLIYSSCLILSFCSALQLLCDFCCCRYHLFNHLYILQVVLFRHISGSLSNIHIKRIEVIHILFNFCTSSSLLQSRGMRTQSFLFIRPFSSIQTPTMISRRM